MNQFQASKYKRSLYEVSVGIPPVISYLDSMAEMSYEILYTVTY